MAHFKWYFDPLCLLSSIKKTFKKRGQSQNFLDPRIESAIFIYFFLSDNSEVATAVIVSRGVENISFVD